MIAASGDVATWLLIAGGAILLVVIVARLWRALLAVAGLALVGLLLWAFSTQATATRQVAEVATVAQRQAGSSSALAFVLGALLIAAVIGGLYCWARWKWVERQAARWGRRWQHPQPQPRDFPPAGPWAALPSGQWPPYAYQQQPPPQVVYILPGGGQVFDDAGGDFDEFDDLPDGWGGWQ